MAWCSVFKNTVKSRSHLSLIYDILLNSQEEFLCFVFIAVFIIDGT